MARDGSASVFCCNPRRVPVDVLLRDKDAVRSPADSAVPADPALPPATGPCPVCPLLEEQLRATREAAYWRAMHRRAVERETQLKQRLAEVEAKLRELRCSQ